ncbi:MAG: potassium channel family protein [Myxococcota bacterium]
MKQPTRARFAPLLFAQCLLVLLTEPLAVMENGAIYATLLYPLTLAGLVFAVGRSGRLGQIVVLIWFGTVALELAVRTTTEAMMPVAGRVLDATLVMLGCFILLSEILRRHRVTFDTLLGGISVYLMIGFFYALAFNLVEFLKPGSFLDQGVPLTNVAENSPFLATDARFPGLLYYSFVTLTTLGYGDIVPELPLARSLAASEALVGQLYLTVLVAALVGMHMSQRIETKGGAATDSPDDRDGERS